MDVPYACGRIEALEEEVMTTTARPDVAVVYPETDGMPLPDGEYQAPLYRRVLSPLEVRFNDIPDVRINGDTFIYYVEGDPRRSVSPDCYVVLNISPDATASIKRNNVYLLWEVGKAPDFILEIGSKSTASADLGRKRDLYAELGVGEYWRYDQSGGDFYGEPLVGECLVDGEYRRLEIHREPDGKVWSHSEALNLDLWWEDGVLRFYDPVEGHWLLSHMEEYARAEQERARAHNAEARLAELEAELRRLRGE